MLKNGTKPAATKTRVEVLTVDREFERSLCDTFARGGTIDLDLVDGTVSACEEVLGRDGVTVAVIDIDPRTMKEMAAKRKMTPTKMLKLPPMKEYAFSAEKIPLV